MFNKSYYIYIMTNKHNTTFYLGITNDLTRRNLEHQSGSIKGFSKKYNLTKLVYYEEYNNINDALNREKQLKNWHRDWKLNLIKKLNPTLKDLSYGDAETSSA